METKITYLLGIMTESCPTLQFYAVNVSQDYSINNQITSDVFDYFCEPECRQKLNEILDIGEPFKIVDSKKIQGIISL